MHDFFLPDSLLQTSCEQMTGKTAERLKKNVVVRFTGEEGMVRRYYGNVINSTYYSSTG